MLIRLLALLLCLAPPAFADCLTRDDFARSAVIVGLQAGDQWRVTRTDAGVQAEYRDRDGEPLRWQTAEFGVFPRYEQQNLSADPAAGNLTPFRIGQWKLETIYDQPPPLPVAGGNFTTTGIANGLFDGVKRTWPFSVVYSFDPEKTVSLTGCRYRTIGVNGIFHSSSGDWTGRWIYFPDLSVGIQTKGNDSRTGEVWINGMAALGD